MTALELSTAIQEKKLSVTEAVANCFEKIEKSQSGSFLALTKEQVFAQAKKVQAQIDAGDIPSPLVGVPIGIKDNITTMGIETTCASKMLEGYVPVFNATVVDKLEQAGMIVIGKLDMNEFAMGSAPAKEGGAAAVAAGEIPLAIVSDTGGDIRQPCAFYGATGIKPTYGAVSRHGLVAHASSMDQIGVIGRTVDDCTALLSIISGPDDMDATCIIDKPFSFKDNAPTLDGLRIGVPKNCAESGIDTVLKRLKAAGVMAEAFEMPLLEYMIPIYEIIACAEASSNLARFDGLKFGYRNPDAESLVDVYRLSRGEGFGLEVKQRIMFGSFALSAGCYDDYYKKALQARTLIKAAYKALFEKYDVIIAPAPPDKLDAITVSVNLAGLPAVALPTGFQLIGNAFAEKKLINTARVIEQLKGGM
ncbi:MAG: aspartyl/glutamyl-tRNA amidotransferase subunit A [Defluviitaleaceae bacterium]|nr:aspartyl/glutamyl-tRNA amidotransferase subunit A [Defluviitaleaceae bacterium]